MACSSCAADKAGPNNSPAWRRALWIALAVNAVMFAGELVAGILGGSKALQADALDFLGDAANYAISLGVAGLALGWRARAALVKGATIFGVGLYVLLSALWALSRGTVPHAEVMGAVGFVALLANGGVALMLYRFRDGDANMRSVWICSRNDAIGNGGLSSNGTENLHKGLQASSIPVAPGSRSGLNSPRATMSGMVKA